jgi:hypothetical protein
MKKALYSYDSKVLIFLVKLYKRRLKIVKIYQLKQIDLELVFKQGDQFKSVYTSY